VPKPATIAALAVTALGAGGAVLFLLSSGGGQGRLPRAGGGAGASTVTATAVVASASSTKSNTSTSTSTSTSSSATTGTSANTGATASTSTSPGTSATAGTSTSPGTSATAGARTGTGHAAPEARTTAAITVDVPVDQVAKLADKLTLRPDQRERLNAIYREGGLEFGRLLREEASKPVVPGAPPPAGEAFGRITEQVARSIEAKVREMLDPAQVPIFEALVEEERRAKDAAPPATSAPSVAK